MGLEWINKAGKSFSRSCGRGYRSLTSAHLFDASVLPIERSFKAKFLEGHILPAGTEITVRVESDGLKLYDKDEQIVGLPDDPPPWLVAKLSLVPGGIAVGVIEDIRLLSGGADVVVQ
jgi:hypothetical protein